MAFLALIELIVVILLGWFIISRVVRYFAPAEKPGAQKLLTAVGEAEQRRYELNLLALRAKQERELKTLELELVAENHERAAEAVEAQHVDAPQGQGEKP